MRRGVFIIFYCLLIFASYFFVLKVKATTISPAKYLITLASGDTGNVAVTIKNDENTDVEYSFSVLGVKQSELGGPLFLSGLSEVESWIVPEIKQISIASGEEKNINFKINIPATVYSGSYYLGLAVQKINLPGSDVGLSGRLITLLNLQVAGEAREVLQINEFNLNQKLSKNREDFTFVLGLKNQGNVDLPLKGEIKILDWKKKEISNQEVYLGNNLLPSSNRRLTLIFDKSLSWSPVYFAQVVVDYGRTKQVAQKTIFINNLSVTYIIFGFIFLILLYLIKTKKKAIKI
ncbi:MAG: hypothetical protein US42_C0008G0003 [Candidatus Magasanikbacteria bacterium GW2011_GWC2_37_14]|uniref:Uncharacterized protein n=1 Tax=Candidatus Magasanikbacteria bacterium GW2011_GWC2_37_14 TaxID=1619046 RepID=A0A0G0GBY9_9BACT|nr:MAG: hypothetical protein US42_C0008G0003 [Candidatus Magasanikbacteria bacterium GW2011_GWC2_37_14]